MNIPQNTNDFMYHVIPCRQSNNPQRKELEIVYECWKKVWSVAMKNEMHQIDPLKSNPFTGNDYVAAIFYKGKCASLTTMRFHDLNSSIAQDDDFYSVWPETAVASLKRDFSKIIVLGNFTIGYEFRRDAFGIKWKDLNFLILGQFLRSTFFDCMLGTPRLDKKVEEVVYRTGARPLARRIPYKYPGHFADLVAWDKNEKLNSPWLPLAKTIWKKRTINSYETEIKGDKDAA